MKSNELKDSIVYYLIKQSNEKGGSFDIDTDVSSVDLKCTPNEMNRVIDSLASEGYIDALGLLRNNYTVKVNQKLYDMYDCGGFTRQYEALKLQFEQLKLEVEKLQNDEMEKLEKGTTIMNNIIELGGKFIKTAGFIINNLQ